MNKLIASMALLGCVPFGAMAANAHSGTAVTEHEATVQVARWHIRPGQTEPQITELDGRTV